MTIKAETKKDYQERVNKVLEFINNNLDQDLELERLSAISKFSPFHFHRIMRAHLNESLGSFVQRLRLDRAAGLLLHSKESIADVGYFVGYDSPSSFSKAFKKRFSATPVEFRKSMVNFSVDLEIVQLNKTKLMKDLKPKIKNLKPKKVIYVQKTGAYDNKETELAWEKVCDFARKKRLFGMNTEFIGISYDDPDITEEDKLRYDACVVVRKDVEAEGDIGFKEISGGNYAIFRHNGPYKDFHKTYDFIYRKWLPESEFEVRDLACFELYLNSPDKTKPEKLKTDIYVPII